MNEEIKNDYDNALNFWNVNFALREKDKNTDL